MTGQVRLRAITADDLPAIFEQQLDPDANRMAAFTADDPTDRDAFHAHWDRLFADPGILKRAIVRDGVLVGTVMSFERLGKPEVTYWIRREHWGQGLATLGLTELLKELTARPVYARAAADNAASIRVLEKCGFRIIDRETGFASARGCEIEEVVMELA